MDVANDVNVTLHTDEPVGVSHPDCDQRADVFPQLDAFFCTKCQWNGRISGAWFLDLLAEKNR